MVIPTVMFNYFINIYLAQIYFDNIKDAIVTCFSKSQFFNLQKKVNSPTKAIVLDAGKVTNETHIL